MLDHTFFSRELPELVDLKHAHSFDVDGPAKLVNLVVPMGVNLLHLISLLEIVVLQDKRVITESALRR